MTSTPRYTHSFSLNSEDEAMLQEALKKTKGRYGIIDIVRIGINRFLHADDFDKVIEKSRDAKVKK